MTDRLERVTPQTPPESLTPFLEILRSNFLSSYPLQIFSKPGALHHLPGGEASCQGGGGVPPQSSSASSLFFQPHNSPSTPPTPNSNST